MTIPADTPAPDNPTAATAGDLWLPIGSGWREKEVERLVATHDGLAAAGAGVRLDWIGTAELPLTMLQVRAPVPCVEAAEHWLLRFVQPLPVDAMEVPPDEIALTVPTAAVDRAVQLLRAAPDTW